MRHTLLLFLCLIQGVAFSQNQARYAQMNFAPGVLNPAALAIDAQYQVDLMFRNQWFQFDGAPTSFAANLQYELDFDMAVGLNFQHDRIGAYQSNSVSGQYAYRAVFDNASALIFGIGLGIESKSLDLSGSVLTQAGDPAFAQNYSKIFFNAAAGIYYYSPRFYVGASVPQLFQTNFGADDGFKVKRFHYYMSTGLYLDAGRNYTFNPNLQVKMVMGAPAQADLILRNTFHGRFSLVVGYRSENSIIAGADFLITPFMRAGYSFNYDVGSLSRMKGMSNELYLGFGMPYRSDRNKFGKRRYINRKGRFGREHKHNYRKKRRRQ